MAPVMIFHNPSMQYKSSMQLAIFTRPILLSHGLPVTQYGDISKACNLAQVTTDDIKP